GQGEGKLYGTVPQGAAGAPGEPGQTRGGRVGEASTLVAPAGLSPLVSHVSRPRSQASFPGLVPGSSAGALSGHRGAHLSNTKRHPMPKLDLTSIHPGLVGSASLVVGPEHTAPRIGSGRIPVLATPVMISLLEAAALAAAEPLLPAGHQSLGI